MAATAAGKLSADFPVAIEAVALDLDGTLLHTAPDLAVAANLMLAELDMAPVAENVVMTYVGNGASKLIKRLLTGSMEGEPEARILQHAQILFYRYYADVLDVHTQFYPGVIEGLRALKQAGFRLACITNKPEQFTVPLLKTMGLYAYFELVVSGDSLTQKKPDPMPLLHVCEQFGINPNDMAMIGDSAADMQAAQAAGCYSIYVPYGYNRGISAAAIGADAIIDSLADVTQVVHKNKRACPA